MTDRYEPTRGAGADRLPEAPGPDLSPDPSPSLGLDLGRALRGLPRERAAAGFTRRVLDRLDSTNGSTVPMARARRFAALRWAAPSALAAVALAALIARVALEVDPLPEITEGPRPAAVAEATPPETPEPPAAPATPTASATIPVAQAATPPGSRSRAERLAALDAERARIARELAEIRRLAREPLPVVYVGGDESVDFVVDLQSLSRMARLEGSGPGDRTLRPTGTTIEDPERNPR